MEIKAKDMCPRCKYCLGMTPQGMYSCGYAYDDSELNIGIEVVLSCANFEWKDEKIEGKVSDFCPKCKNCKGVTRESNGVHAWLTEVECEDPYDGMTKTLDADSNICCSMFESMPDHGRYPWGSDEDKGLKYCANDVTIIAEQMAREKQKELEDKVDKYEEILVDICDALDPHFDFDNYDDEMEAFEKFPSRILDLKKSCKDNFDECIRKLDIIDDLKTENVKLEKEKAAHLKGIERLKKSQEKLQNQIKNLQTTNEESYKREEKLEDKCRKLERRLLDENKKNQFEKIAQVAINRI